MKKYFFLYILMAFVLMAGFLLSRAFLSVPVAQDINMIAVNEIVKSAEQNWINLESLQDKAFNYDFLLIDRNGNCLYRSDPQLPKDLHTAIRLGFVSLDITVDDRVMGKVLIEANPAGLNEQVRKQYISLSLAVLLLLCVISLLFLIFVNSVVIKPFHKLELFAYKISTGKFDEPLPMDKHNTFGAFTESFDMMRASLQEAQQRERRAEKAKKELIASLSHDIKTPVTSIKLIAELLQTGILEPSAAEKLKMIERKAEQIDRLMSDLLNSTLDEMDALAVNISSEPSDILQDLFQNADPYGLVRIRNIPGCLVDLDVSRMEQVVNNLISNSYKYAKTDIDVTCSIDSEYLHVEINDYGMCAEPNIELLCSKYYRGTNAITLQKEGEGLGLYIAKLLMNKMSGDLMVYNRSDGFTARLLIRLSK